MSDTASTVSSEASPTKRPRPPALRMDHLGIDPQSLVGKVLTSVRRSPAHPALTLNFSDNTSYQILVDGYSPAFPGVPKGLDYDPLFYTILDNGNDLDLMIMDCAHITLSDIAFERKPTPNGDRLTQDLRWDQKHLAVAFKFSEPIPRWHCVWAMLEDRDEEEGICIFRSYDDVYVQELQRSPRKPRYRRTPSCSPRKKQRTGAHPWD